MARPPSPFKLQRLPYEIQRLIAAQIDYTPLRHLATSCRSLRRGFQHTLFKRSAFRLSQVTSAGFRRFVDLLSSPGMDQHMCRFIEHLELRCRLDRYEEYLIFPTSDTKQDRTLDLCALHNLLHRLPNLRRLVVIGYHFSHDSRMLRSPHPPVNLPELTLVAVGFWVNLASHREGETSHWSTRVLEKVLDTNVYAANPSVITHFFSGFASIGLLKIFNLRIVPITHDDPSRRPHPRLPDEELPRVSIQSIVLPPDLDSRMEPRDKRTLHAHELLMALGCTVYISGLNSLAYLEGHGPSKRLDMIPSWVPATVQHPRVQQIFRGDGVHVLLSQWLGHRAFERYASSLR